MTVKHRKRKRWPGTRAQAAWLQVKRVYGGERAARKVFLEIVTSGMEDDLYDYFTCFHGLMDSTREDAESPSTASQERKH
jgi:hypothetical protein